METGSPRRNRVKDKLQRGEVALVVSSPNDADAIEALGHVGVVDGVWVDMEHGPTTWRELGDYARAAELTGMTPLVRVMHGDRWVVGRALDRGFQGAVVPHCSTRDSAEELVAGTFYAPWGHRGMTSKTRNALGLPLDAYVATANEHLMTIVMIEELEAIRNLDDLLTVEHIDCYFVAPNDLSQSMGPEFAGRASDPAVTRLVDETIRRVVAAGRVAGTLVGEKNAEHMAELGARLLLTATQPFIDAGMRRMSASIERYGAPAR